MDNLCISSLPSIIGKDGNVLYLNIEYDEDDAILANYVIITSKEKIVFKLVCKEDVINLLEWFEDNRFFIYDEKMKTLNYMELYKLLKGELK